MPPGTSHPAPSADPEPSWCFASPPPSRSVRTAVSPGGEEPPARGAKTQLGTLSERVSERDGGFVVGTGRRGKCEVLPSRQPHRASGKERTSSCWKKPSLPLRRLFSRRRELAVPRHVGKPRGGCPNGTRCFHPCFSPACHPALPLRRAPRALELGGRQAVLGGSPACVPTCVLPLPGLHGLAAVSAKGFLRAFSGRAMR